MGYGAAGLGYGMSQAFSGMGDALDRVVRRRDERDRYESALKMDAERRKEEHDRQAFLDNRYDESIQRAATAAERAEQIRQAERAQNRMNQLTDQFHAVQASGEYPDAQFIPGVAGPSQIDYGERQRFGGVNTPGGYFDFQGGIMPGTQPRPPAGPQPVSWQTREMPEGSGNFVQINPVTGETRPVDPSGGMGGGMGGKAFGKPGRGMGGQAEEFDPDAYAMGRR